jgi:N-acetylglucosaminyl-diphospho-decaprenol L-rhamnosyltransferase
MPPSAKPNDPEVDLTIIVVSYNTKALTLEALRSLYRFPPPVSFEVIVVDNASPDGSADAIADFGHDIILLRLDDNIGFAAANNLAALRARGRRILLLNPDTVTLDGSHRNLWAFAEAEPERGIWGGRTLFSDGSLNPTSCWSKMTLWTLTCAAFGLTHLFPNSRLFSSERFGSWPRDRIADVDIVTGCFLMIDAKLWRELGGFDPTFFMYAEEADLCLRAARLGARPGISPKAEIIHFGGMSEPTGADKIVKTVRGKITLMRKHWGPVRTRIGRGLLLIWAWLRLVGSTFLSGRRDAPGVARQKWANVWSRRNEWMAGYPDAERTQS